MLLLVENNEDIREVTSTFLNLEGYACLQAGNGEEALSMLRMLPENPQLILLDMMMPIMDGWEFLEAKAKIPSIANIPVIIISASPTLYPLPDYVVAALWKPVDIKQLVTLIREHCLPEGNGLLS